MLANHFILLVTAFIAAIYDYKTNKIPNWCIYPLIISGLFYQIFTHTGISLWSFVPIIIFFVAMIFINDWSLDIFKGESSVRKSFHFTRNGIYSSNTCTVIGFGDLKFVLGCSLIISPRFAVFMFLRANYIVGIAFLLLRVKEVIMVLHMKDYTVLWSKTKLPMGFAFALSSVIGIYAGF